MKSIWVLFISIFLTGIVGFGVFKYRKAIKPSVEIDEWIEINRVISRLAEYWSLDGSSDYESWTAKCSDDFPQKRKWDRDFLRCRPEFFSCLIENDLEEGKLGKTKIEIIEKGFPTKLNITHNEISLPISFHDSCRMTYLPRKQYVLGLFDPDSSRGDDWKWDNFNQDIFVDRFLVTNSDIKWFNRKKGTQFPYDRAPGKRDLPAGSLTVKQMKLFCQSHGKELMEAKVWDASAFFPDNPDVFETKSFIRGPYHWTRKKENEIPIQVKNGEVNNWPTEFCHKIYSKECWQKMAYSPFPLKSLSWVGMGHVLGGVLEAVENKANPKNNLVASSYYFNMDSYWHQIGARANWNGMRGKKLKINWNLRGAKENEALEEWEIGFRCLRRVK